LKRCEKKTRVVVWLLLPPLPTLVAADGHLFFFVHLSHHPHRHLIYVFLLIPSSQLSNSYTKEVKGASPPPPPPHHQLAMCEEEEEDVSRLVMEALDEALPPLVPETYRLYCAATFKADDWLAYQVVGVRHG
jgi:hypothetical protein